ncbi:MAG: O-antigen ligase family protein [Flavisolibacter sp.]
MERIFIREKLNNWAGFLLLTLIAVGFGYFIARETFIGLGLFIVVLGLFTIGLCMVSIEAGLYLNIVYAFFAFHFSRFLFRNDDFPVGIIMDILIGTTFLGLLVNRINLRKSLNEFIKTPVAVGMVVLLFFLLLENFNVYGHSFEGWFQTFRRFLGSVLLLFISFNIFTDYRKIRRFIIVLFILCTITGIYACIQQWHGLFDFELYWVTSNDNRYGLYFIMGDFRKFSTMSDPTAFAIAMAASSIFFMIVAWHEKKTRNKIILFTGVIFMLLGMAYSGTRTANIQLAAGMLIFVLLTFNRKSTKLFAVASALIFIFLLYGPYVNSTIIRFRSSFMGSDDPSFKVRDINRANIQPYIYTHPIGGGLGTSGASGLRFNRGHFLAGFPPDSGYLRKAIETGWIGLALIIVLYFIVTKTGIRGYFRSRSQKLKILYAACTASIFSFYVAEFPQEAIGQITDVVIYYPMIALILRLPFLEHKKETHEEALNNMA